MLRLKVVFGWDGSGKSKLIDALLNSSSNVRVVLDDGRQDLIASLEEALSSPVSSAASKGLSLWIEAAAEVVPIEVVELFYLEGENGEPPEDRFEIESSIAVVDGKRFLEDLQFPKSFESLGLGLGDFDEFDDRTTADVIVEQIEFCDVIVMNRTSDIDSSLFEKTRSAIEWLNPRAQIVEIPPEGPHPEFIKDFLSVCSRQPFDFEETAEGAGWIQVLANSHPRRERGQEISAVAFRARRPVHPERFQNFIESLKRQNILRVKGWIWIASRNAEVGIWSMAGGSSQLDSAGAWLAATPMGEWPTDPQERADVMAEWVAPYGDRRQEFAILGFQLNEFDLRKSFKQCLLTDEEFELGPEVWSRWNDPLPDWSVGDSDQDFDGLLN